MKNYFLYLIYILIFYSCSKQKEREVIFEYNFEDIDKNFYQNNDFNKSIGDDTLFIKIILDECGEWGGPQEKIKIFKNHNNEITLNYSKFRFNCDSIADYYTIEPLLEYNKIIILNEDSQYKVVSYLAELSKAKLYEYVYSNAGSLYEITKSDSTMYINIHTENKDLENLYLNLKKDLKLLKK